jgi:hypothetical protein
MALGLERKPYPWLEDCAIFRDLRKYQTRKVENTKIEELVNDRILPKLDESGHIDRLYNASPAQ